VREAANQPAVSKSASVFPQPTAALEMQPSWGCLGALGAVLGPSWGRLGPSWGHLGALGAVSGPSWGRLGAVLGPS
jgi:hypothetical protein